VTRNRTATLALLALTALALSACTAVSRFRVDGGPVRAGETELGHVTGEAQAHMVLGVVTPDVSQRFERAHRDALEEAQGATRLADVEVTEDIMNLFVWQRIVTRVTGIAVQTE
jgi:hypothetical protein